MLQSLRRALSPLGLLVVLLSTSSFLLGGGLREPIHQAYDPLLNEPIHPTVDPIRGYIEAKKNLTEKATDLLKRGLGQNYLTNKLAPILLESLSSSVSPDQSGRLGLRDPNLLLDDTANRLAARGKRELANFSRDNLPGLPVVGNLVEDLARGQNLRVCSGRVHYDFRLRKRFATDIQFGQLSLSGGAEAYLDGRRVSRKSVASVRYHTAGGSYQLQLVGRKVRIELQMLPIDLRFDWEHSVMKFCVKLNLGWR